MFGRPTLRCFFGDQTIESDCFVHTGKQSGEYNLQKTWEGPIPQIKFRALKAPPQTN